MRIFNQILIFIGGSVRRLVVFCALLFFFGGQIMGWWDSPSLVNINVAPPAELTQILKGESKSGAEIWSGGAHSAENATRHFRKHGDEFPFQTEAEYIAAAQSFVMTPPAGTKTVIQKDGDQVFYNAELNYFAVKSPEGKIRTFFRLDPGIHGHKSNLDYFEAQAAK